MPKIFSIMYSIEMSKYKISYIISHQLVSVWFPRKLLLLLLSEPHQLIREYSNTDVDVNVVTLSTALVDWKQP